MIQQFLRIYNGYLDSKGRSLITERTINLLSFYINYGYSDDTRAKYMDCYGQKESYIAVLNNELKRGGFLVDKKNGNFRTRELSIEMRSLRNYFVLDGEGECESCRGMEYTDIDSVIDDSNVKDVIEHPQKVYITRVNARSGSITYTESQNEEFSDIAVAARKDTKGAVITLSLIHI